MSGYIYTNKLFFTIFMILLVMGLYFLRLYFVEISSYEPPQQKQYALDWQSTVHEDYQLILNKRELLTNARLIVYNRVSKCGSSTTLALVQKLSHINHFHNYPALIYNQLHIDEENQIKWIRKITALKKPAFIDRHIYFLNFTRFGYAMPEYINLIRDPISRFTSQFHYARQYSSKSLSYNTTNFSINKCIEENQTECSGSGLFSIIPYFCGQAPFCKTPCASALNKAMYNAVHFYAVVGLSEHYLDFLKLLEHTFPGFFSGIEALYKQSPQKRKTSKHTENITAYNRNRLVTSTAMQLEYTFYNFIKKRFLLVKEKLSSVV